MKKLLLPLLFLSNATAFAQFSVTVNGNAVTNGGTYNLGNQTNTQSISLAITNNGSTAAIIIDDDADVTLIDLDGNAGAECTSDAPTGSISFNAGETKTYTITYTPVTAGNRTITVYFAVLSSTVYSFDITANMTVTSTLNRNSNMAYLAPNPFVEQATLVLTDESNESYDIMVSTTSGKIMEHYSVPAQQNEIIIGNNLPAGVYVVTIKSASGISVQKIVKE